MFAEVELIAVIELGYGWRGVMRTCAIWWVSIPNNFLCTIWTCRYDFYFGGLDSAFWWFFIFFHEVVSAADNTSAFSFVYSDAAVNRQRWSQLHSQTRMRWVDTLDMVLLPCDSLCSPLNSHRISQSARWTEVITVVPPVEAGPEQGTFKLDQIKYSAWCFG